MANNYIQFSFAIPLDTPEKTEWATRAVAFLNEADHEATLTRLAAIEDGGEDAPEPHEFDELLPDELLDNEYLGYRVAVDEDGIWIYAEDSGTPENVIPFVQVFLTKFNPQGHVGFAWADTCSKPRLDEFGGGALWITATGTEFMNTYQWLANKERG